MRCLTCGLEMIDTIAPMSVPATVRVCPRCGQLLEQESNSYQSLVAGPPGQPRFTLPAHNLSNKRIDGLPDQNRPHARRELHRRLPYPTFPPLPKSRAPLIIGSLSTIVIVALLFGVGLLWRGGLDANIAHTTLVPKSAHTRAISSTVTPAEGATVYQSSLQGAAGGWVNNARCTSKADGYHITGAYLCYAPVTQQGDVDITVTAKQLSGQYSLLYGIVLRSSGKGNYYLFGVDGNGKWTFARLSNNTSSYLIQPRANAAIKGTLNQPNTLEVRAIGSHFEFFVNGVQIGQADDAAYSTGLIGLTSEGGVEVVYANMAIVRP